MSMPVYALPPYALPPYQTAAATGLTQLQDLSQTPPVNVNFWVSTAIFASVFYDTKAQLPCFFQYKSINGYYSIWNDPDAVAKNDHTFQQIETVLQPNSAYTPPTGSAAALLKTYASQISSLTSSKNTDEATIATLQAQVGQLTTALVNFGLVVNTAGTLSQASGTLPTASKIMTNWNNIAAIGAKMNANVGIINANTTAYNGLSTLNLAAGANTKMSSVTTLTLS